VDVQVARAWLTLLGDRRPPGRHEDWHVRTRRRDDGGVSHADTTSVVGLEQIDRRSSPNSNNVTGGGKSGTESTLAMVYQRAAHIRALVDRPS
jgi:hypothetical protein